METLPDSLSTLPSINSLIQFFDSKSSGHYTESQAISTTVTEISKSKAVETSWEQLIDRLSEIFESDSVNVDEVKEVLSSYRTNKEDWKKYAIFDPIRYTRNLVFESKDGKFNLMVLCWAPGIHSSIHNHPNCHCFVKNLDGVVKETRYFWPHEKESEDGSMVEKGSGYLKADEVTYMSDKLGLHRVGNTSHSNGAVTLHLYSPPFQSAQAFDEQNGQALRVPMTFWSEYGEKVHHPFFDWIHRFGSIDN